MTPIPQNPEAPGISPPRAMSARLTEPLRIVAGRARLLAFFRAAFKLLFIAALAWLMVVLLLGSSLHIPVWIAFPLPAIAWAIVIFSAVRLLRPVFRRRDLASAALLVDEAFPESQERISSALEISQEPNAAFRGSPELVAQLFRQAEHHAESMNPTIVVSGREVFRWFVAFIALFLAWFILVVVFTPNMLLGLQRSLQPWSVTAPPSPILEVSPGDITLDQGKSIDGGITVDVKPPAGLSLDTGNQLITRAALIRHFTNPAGGASVSDVSTEMERTGPRSFRVLVDNIQQPFTYRIIAEGDRNVGRAESPNYTVTLQTHPALANLELVYRYPDYTHLPSRTDLSREGAIEGLVSTKVRINMETSQPVASGKLTIDDPGSGPGLIELVPVTAPVAPGAAPANPRYTAELTILKTTQYRIHLTTTEGRDNSDSQPRTITARPDELPTIRLNSPDASLTVRPDDTVPIQFLATDDFGITKLEALIQIDDRPILTMPIQLPAGDAQTRIAEDWNLSLSDLLKSDSRPGLPEPRRVAYQFKATDNHDPNPQEGVSVRQMLTLDKNTIPLAQRLDTQSAKDLATAVQKAGDALKDAQQKLDDLNKSDRNRAPDEQDQQRLTDAHNDIVEARQQMTRAADQADTTRLSAMARQMRDIADQPARRAEEDVVKSQLAADQPAERQAAEQSAQRNVNDAVQQLNQLANTVKETAHTQPLAHSLERLAEQQRQLADALAKNPNDPKLLEQQRALQQQLDQLVKDNPELQKPAAQASQARVDDLVQRLQQIEQAQQSIKDQLKNQSTASSFPDQSKDLARQQQQLNRDITQFSQQQTDALKQAATSPPEPSKLDPIVKELQDSKLAAASRDQKAVASQLDQTANKLDGIQRQLDSTTSVRQKTADQAARQAKAAAEIQQQVNQLGQKIQTAKTNHNPPTRPSDPANQQASKLADQIKQEARQLAQNPAAKNAAQSVSSAADAAQRAANQGQADSAQQQLSSAASQLTQAAQAAQNAAGPLPTADNPSTPAPNSSGQPSQQARALAERQHALADQAAQLAKARDDASNARSNSASTAEKQQQLADQLTQAGRDAQALQQQTQNSAPDLAGRAAQADKALQQAAQAQRDAAEAIRQSDAAKAAASQDQSAKSLTSAEQALGTQSQPSQPATAGTPIAANVPPSTPNAPFSASSPPSPSRDSGQSAATPGSLNNSPQSPSQDAAQSAAQAVQSARSSQTQALSGSAAAARQAAEQLAQASHQLAPGNSPSPLSAGSPQNQSGAMPGSSPAGQSAAGSAGSPGSGSAPGNPGPPGGGGIQLTDTARTIDPPKEIQEVGLSPSDWARLPPNMQDELLHAAQQPGPPSYRDMIKNYYTRIARLQPETGTTK